MLRRFLTAFLSALFLLGGAAPGTRATASGPTWAASWGANPALVAFQPAESSGQVALTTELRSLEPFDARFLASYAVPDTGYGAAAATILVSRLPQDNGLARNEGLAYTWGRRWSDGLAAGAMLHWEKQWTELEAGFSTPLEQGWGLDVGGLYQPDERTWLGLTVLDLFGTALRSPGSADVRPASLQVTAGQRLTPALTISLQGDDVLATTGAGARWRGEARVAKDRFTWRAGVVAGAAFGWSLGISTGDRPYRLDLSLDGTGEGAGVTLGVTYRW